MSQDHPSEHSDAPGIDAIFAEYLEHIDSGADPEQFLADHPHAAPVLRELLDFQSTLATDLAPPSDEAVEQARRQMHARLSWRRLRQLILRLPFRRPRLWVVAGSLGIGLSFSAAFAQEAGRVVQPFTAVVQRLPAVVSTGAKGPPEMFDEQLPPIPVPPPDPAIAIAPATPQLTPTPTLEPAATVTPSATRTRPLANTGAGDSPTPGTEASEGAEPDAEQRQTPTAHQAPEEDRRDDEERQTATATLSAGSATPAAPASSPSPSASPSQSPGTPTPDAKTPVPGTPTTPDLTPTPPDGTPPPSTPSPAPTATRTPIVNQPGGHLPTPTATRTPVPPQTATPPPTPTEHIGSNECDEETGETPTPDGTPEITLDPGAELCDDGPPSATPTPEGPGLANPEADPQEPPAQDAKTVTPGLTTPTPTPIIIIPVTPSSTPILLTPVSTATPWPEEEEADEEEGGEEGSGKPTNDGTEQHDPEVDEPAIEPPEEDETIGEQPIDTDLEPEEEADASIVIEPIDPKDEAAAEEPGPEPAVPGGSTPGLETPLETGASTEACTGASAQLVTIGLVVEDALERSACEPP